MIKNFLKKILYPEYRIQYLVNRYIEYEFSESKYRLILKLLLRSILMTKYGIIIGANSKIERGINLFHPINIVIGDRCIIGKNCTIYHDVTLGQNHGKYPVIGDNVIIYPGAKIIGDVKVGNNAIIGANAVVVKDVLDNQIVGGVPAKVIGVNSDGKEFY